MNDTSVDLLINILKEKYGNERVKINEVLDRYTTFKIGGPAKIFFLAKDIEELIFVIRQAMQLKVPYFVMGGGTNLLFDDKGFPGLIIKNSTDKITIKKYGGSFSKNKLQRGIVTIEVLSGVGVNQLVRFTLEAALTGLEAFLGQPGTVGGAIYINAHNMEMGEFFGDKIKSAKILTAEGQVKEVHRSYFRFGYDESILQKRKDVVLSVTLDLERSDKEKIWQKANRAMEYRKYTQPLGVGSAGCTFRNISKSQALRIGTPNETTSAGYLIEAIGLKGYTIGGAKISEKHANFIVNTGGAKAADVVKIIDLVKKKIKQRFAVDLQEEVVYVGGDKLWKN